MIHTGLDRKNIVIEISGFLFFLYEFWHFSQTEFIYATDGSMEIYFVRFVLLYIALPVLYLFQIATFLGIEESVAHILSVIFKFENSHTYTQIKMFYHVTIFLLLILVILKGVEGFF